MDGRRRPVRDDLGRDARAGGVLTVAGGVLLVGGWWGDLTIQLRSWAAGFSSAV